jgi:type II secretory pathway pseudopilin PulG
MTQRCQGFSFLETTLILSVAALVTLAGLASYRAQQTRSDKETLRRHVEILLVATNAYYQAHCHDSVIASVSLPQLKTESFLDVIPVNPLSGQYTVSVIRVPIPSVRVQASVNLPNADQQLAAFGANSFTNNRLTWVRPIKTSSTSGQQTRTHRSMYEGDCV